MLDFPLVPPGVLYDVGHQCRLQYGPYSTFCDDMDVSGVPGGLWAGALGWGCALLARGLDLCQRDGSVPGSTAGTVSLCFPQSVCNTLWCTVGNTCHSKLDAAVDGTACGESKVTGGDTPPWPRGPLVLHTQELCRLQCRDGLILLPLLCPNTHCSQQGLPSGKLKSPWEGDSLGIA